MSTPLNPAALLSQDSLEDYAPLKNIYVSSEAIDDGDVILRKKTNTSFKQEPFVPASNKNMLLPVFVDKPVIETSSFKAYILLVEENIFLQNVAKGSSYRRSRAQRRDLLANSTNHLDELEHSAESTTSGTAMEVANGAAVEQPEASEEDDKPSDSLPAIVRGILVIRVLKHNTKIKNIKMNFKGDSRTNWPEGIPPKKTEFLEIENIVDYDWSMFDVNDVDQNHYNKGGANHINTLPESVIEKENGDIEHMDLNRPSGFFSSLSAVPLNGSNITVKKSRFFNFGKKKILDKATPAVARSTKSLDIRRVASNEALKTEYFDSQGSYVFQPGDYIYSFEKTIPQSSPESLGLTFGFVNYWLNLEIGRVGKFKSTLRAKKKINLIRTNSSQSIEDNFDPIMINKSWEDRLQYSILIASNSVILNSFIPINIRFVPTDKNVKLYKIKIFLVEILEYWCKERKVHRLEPQRKFLLLEHKPKVGTNLLRDFEDINFNNSVITEKGLNDARVHRSSVNVEDSVPVFLQERNKLNNPEDKRKKKAKKPKKPITNEDDETEYISSKDFNYQLYIPEMFSKFSSKLHPDTKQKNIQCHHWIKISLRLSKKVDEFETVKENDPVDPTRIDEEDHSDGSAGPATGGIPSRRSSFGRIRRNSFAAKIPKKPEPKRRHYEISIDSPITVLNSLCTQANTLLPAYDGKALYNPYTSARRKETGEIEILTNNNPMFPPEILSNNFNETDIKPSTLHSLNLVPNEEIKIINPLDAYKVSLRPAKETLLSQEEDHTPEPVDYSNLDEDFQQEFTPQLTSANLYLPNAIDLDLASVQAIPMNPNNFGNLLPLTLTNENIDNLLSGGDHLSPRTSNNPISLSPNFKALSPTLRALSPLNGSSAYKSEASSIKSPQLVAHNLSNNILHHSAHVAIPDNFMHLLNKPSIKPPTYDQSLGIEPTVNNKVLNSMILQNGQDLVYAPPPPTYDNVVHENVRIKVLKKFVDSTIDDNYDTDGDDVAGGFSFAGINPDLPHIISQPASSDHPQLFTGFENLNSTQSTADLSENGAATVESLVAQKPLLTQETNTSSSLLIEKMPSRLSKKFTISLTSILNPLKTNKKLDLLHDDASNDDLGLR